MKVTIVLAEQVWREFRGECFKRGIHASHVIEAALRDQLRKWGVEVKEEPKRKKGGKN